MSIKCEWAKHNRFVVNPDGQVWPCCYLATLEYVSTIFKDIDRYDEVIQQHQNEMNHPVMKAYLENKQKHNAFNVPVNEILESEWFKKILPESWESEETTHGKCKHFCTKDL